MVRQKELIPAVEFTDQCRTDMEIDGCNEDW